MARILGIDPGSRCTGWGLIDKQGNKISFVDCGFIKTPAGDLAPRLQAIYVGLTQQIETYRPDEMAIEQVFMARNADSALKLGQARGAAIVAATNSLVSVAEYSARQVKQAVVGTGAADKSQVQNMITRLLCLPEVPQADAADALAIAICHANANQGLRALGATATRRKRVRW